jgi:uncharacterized protein
VSAWPPVTARGEEKHYYDRLADGVIVYQHCDSCQKTVFPLRTVCPGCGSEDTLGERESSGRGAIYSHTTQNRAGHPALADRAPYTLVLVDLDEGFRVLTDLVDAEPDSATIGDRVSAIFEKADDGTTILRFRTDEEATP